MVVMERTPPWRDGGSSVATAVHTLPPRSPCGPLGWAGDGVALAVPRLGQAGPWGEGGRERREATPHGLSNRCVGSVCQATRVNGQEE